jgi:hypothetical protein
MMRYILLAFHILTCGRLDGFMSMAAKGSPTCGVHLAPMLLQKMTVQLAHSLASCISD